LQIVLGPSQIGSGQNLATVEALTTVSVPGAATTNMTCLPRKVTVDRATRCTVAAIGATPSGQILPAAQMPLLQ
jgi:hypothetical protein